MSKNKKYSSFLKEQKIFDNWRNYLNEENKMSRPRKNKKFIDPRYFMDEKMETLSEGAEPPEGYISFGTFQPHGVHAYLLVPANVQDLARAGKNFNAMLQQLQGGQYMDTKSGDKVVVTTQLLQQAGFSAEGPTVDMKALKTAVSKIAQAQALPPQA